MNFQHERRSLLKAGAAAAGLMMLDSVTAAGDPVRDSEIVETATGKVRGKTHNGVHVFKGVPYGSDTSARRFMSPLPATPWTGIRDASAYGARAAQPQRKNHPLLEWRDEFNGTSEDCLLLNVWTRGLKDSRKRPVMVWFHGGGFGVGSGSNVVYDGTRLAQRGDVVVITVNHRLNAFGYLYLGELGGAEFADSGNAGMLDLVLALRWVRDNAAAFGGDPGNVTIFGESGGGAKVSLLLGMPAAQGLFHKAIVQSGATLKGMTKTVGTQRAEEFIGKLGLTRATLPEIRKLTMQQILQSQGSGSTMAERMSFSPVTDGRALPRDPFAPGATPLSVDIPVLVGNTQWEYILQFGNEDQTNFKLTFDTLPERLNTYMKSTAIPGEPRTTIAEYRRLYPQHTPSDIFFAVISDGRPIINSILLAERKAQQRRAATYMYRLSWNTPVDGGRWKSPHALDIPFVFDNLAAAASMTPTGTVPDRIALQMSSAWLAFAHTGNPATPSLPSWPAYESNSRSTLSFDSTSIIVKDPHAAAREFWTRAYQAG